MVSNISLFSIFFQKRWENLTQGAKDAQSNFKKGTYLQIQETPTEFHTFFTFK